MHRGIGTEIMKGCCQDEDDHVTWSPGWNACCFTSRHTAYMGLVDPSYEKRHFLRIGVFGCN